MRRTSVNIHPGRHTRGGQNAIPAVARNLVIVSMLQFRGRDREDRTAHLSRQRDRTVCGRTWRAGHVPVARRHMKRDAPGTPDRVQSFWRDVAGLLECSLEQRRVWAATLPQLNGMGGLYCEDCEIAEVDDSEPPSFSGVRSYAVDPAQAERLWMLSAELTGIDVAASAMSNR